MGTWSAKLAAALVLGSMCFGGTTARAEADLNTVLREYDSGDHALHDLWELIVASTENGIAWSNTYLKTVKKTSQLYCTPDKLALTGAQVIDILRREVRERPAMGAQPYTLVIILALQRVFPCNQKR